MSELFDEHRARLTKAEDERVWKRVRERTLGRKKRWSVFGAPAALLTAGAALALVVVVVNREGGPGEALETFRSRDGEVGAPVDRVAGEREDVRPGETELQTGGARVDEGKTVNDPLHPGAIGTGDLDDAKGEQGQVATGDEREATGKLRSLGTLDVSAAGEANWAEAKDQAERALQQRVNEEAARAKLDAEVPPAPSVSSVTASPSGDAGVAEPQRSAQGLGEAKARTTEDLELPEVSVSAQAQRQIPAQEPTDATSLDAGVTSQSRELYRRSGRASGVTERDEGRNVQTPSALSPPPKEQSFGTIAKHGTGEDEATGEAIVRPEVARRPAPQSTGPIAVGGTHPVNDKKIDAMFFRHYGVNPFVETSRDALATFAVDVDNASYALARSYLNRGVLPPKEAIRVEEFINAFEHDYAPPRGDDIADLDPALTHEGTFAIHLDAAPSPLHANTVLLRVGLKGREVETIDRKPLNLTFVIDVSGSMKRESRLELVKRSLVDLLYTLNADDEVAIVTYSNTADVVSPPTSLRNRWALEQLIQGLAPQGGTNAEAGLRLAYTLAERAYDPREENRVVLCSDGVANIGKTGPDSILEEIKKSAGRGIYMTAIGVGMGNYNDVLLEQIADRGDGNYYYVDTPKEAQRVLVDGMVGTMQTIARDAKIQVEFDPEVVASYRLLGYENRDVADVDFRNDAIDAGEVGAGHEVTALFEVHVDGEAPRRGKLAVARIRFEDPDTGIVTEDYDTIRLQDVGRSFERMETSFRLDAAVAGFAEILRASYWTREDTFGEVIDIARDVAVDTRGREDVAELITLISTAERLSTPGDTIDWHEREERWLGEE